MLIRPSESWMAARFLWHCKGKQKCTSAVKCIYWNVGAYWPPDPDSAIKHARRRVHEVTLTLPIILLVELEELTGSVRRKEAVVHVQSRLEGDECGVMLETNITAITQEGVRRRETAVCTIDYKYVWPNIELTAEYIMNLRVLPCSTALEKFLRMAFSRTPGKLTHWCQLCKWNFPRHQHNPFDLTEHLVFAVPSFFSH